MKKETLRRWYPIIKRIPEDREIIGAEIGVFMGITAGRVLRERKNVIHILVDPWGGDKDESYLNSGSQDAEKDQDYFEEVYLRAMLAIAPYRDRTIVHRKKSVDAARDYKNKVLDYVFIDGDHSYEGASRDIAAWLPKVKPGGWIGGHDYDKPRFAGVTQAVREVFPLDEIQQDIDTTWFVRVKE
jgi:hypothetical protein